MNSKETEIRERVKEEFFKYSGVFPTEICQLPNSASGRIYFRISAEGGSTIGTFCDDAEEASAFVYLSEHFLKAGLPVPRVFHYNKENGIYFQSDLGDLTLHRYIEEKGALNSLESCKKALHHLVEFQTKGSDGLDFSVCFPRHSFDEISILWDLNYFKYTFLKPSGISFHEERLENDFRKLASEAVMDDCGYFLYRDFQSRNIMLQCDEMNFIDFQGGRRGSLCYDPASFIYSARSPFDLKVKDELLVFYRDELSKCNKDIARFDKYFYYYLLIRLLQTFGAYGYRGWFERKPAFSEIMPKAVQNFKDLLPRFSFTDKMPELRSVILKISEFSLDAKETLPDDSNLVVNISSFSYKHGLPEDKSGNGGGFIFDCRALPNPGKIEMYKPFSGKDKIVADYLASRPELLSFSENVKSIVSQSVEKYISRGFTHLMVSFGCTGGQHRSVYLAEKLAEFIKSKYPVKVNLEHMMQDSWGRKNIND